MAGVMWLGDDDPSVQQIDQFGYTFVKGVPTDVDAKDANLDAFKDNAFFSVEKSAEPIVSTEPAPADPDKGTEIAAVKADLDTLGVKYRANASIESLRQQLADALA